MATVRFPKTAQCDEAAFESFRESDKGLRIDTIYEVSSPNFGTGTLYAFSPDSIGAIWYDTREELEADAG